MKSSIFEHFSRRSVRLVIRRGSGDIFSNDNPVETVLFFLNWLKETKTKRKKDREIGLIVSVSPLLASNSSGHSSVIRLEKANQRYMAQKMHWALFSFALCLQISASPQSLGHFVRATFIDQLRSRLAV